MTIVVTTDIACDGCASVTVGTRVFYRGSNRPYTDAKNARADARLRGWVHRAANFDTDTPQRDLCPVCKVRPS